MEILQELQKEFGGELTDALRIGNLKLTETLGFVFIDSLPGSFYPSVARLIIKGYLYDKLKSDFDMLESAYYKLEETNMKAQLESIQLS